MVGGGNMKKILVLLISILLFNIIFNIITAFARENPSLTVDNLTLSIGESYNININNKVSRYLNELTVTGLNNCKLIALCTQIIDNPTEVEEGDTDEHNEEDNPKHEQRQAE